MTYITVVSNIFRRKKGIDSILQSTCLRTNICLKYRRSLIPLNHHLTCDVLFSGSQRAIKVYRIPPPLPGAKELAQLCQNIDLHNLVISSTSDHAASVTGLALSSPYRKSPNVVNRHYFVQLGGDEG